MLYNASKLHLPGKVACPAQPSSFHYALPKLVCWLSSLLPVLHDVPQGDYSCKDSVKHKVELSQETADYKLAFLAALFILLCLDCISNFSNSALLFVP